MSDWVSNSSSLSVISATFASRYATLDVPVTGGASKNTDCTPRSSGGIRGKLMISSFLDAGALGKHTGGRPRRQVAKGLRETAGS
jgi:hypothetical protein